MRTSACIRGMLFAGLLAFASAARPAPAVAADDTWLGVYTQEITPDLREGMSYNGKGVLVRRVVDGSPADRAGIQRGDIIVRVGSRDVDSPQTLVDVVRSSPNGKSVPISVVRGESKKALNVTLEQREPGSDFGDDNVPSPPGVPEAPAPPRVHVYGDPDDDDHDFTFEAPAPMSMGRGRLGIRVESLNPDLASYFGGRDTRGALVLDVTDDSPASKAGIRAGDVITEVGSKSVTDSDDLIEAVRSTEGKVSIALVRHGAKQTVEATLDPMRRTMSIRRPMMWKYETPRTPGSRSYDRGRRITIDGDELNPRLKDELDRMQEELKQMREQLDRMHKENQSRLDGLPENEGEGE